MGVFWQVILLCLALISSPTLCLGSTTLQESIEKAIINSKSIKIKQQQTKISDIQLKSTASEFLPSSTINYAINRQRTVIDVPASGSGAFGNGIELSRMFSPRVTSVTASQPISAFITSLPKVQQASTLKQIQALAEQAEIDQVVINTVTAYMSLIKARKVVEAAKEKLNVFSSTFDVVSIKKSFGAASISEYLKSQAALTEAQAQLEKAKGDLSASEVHYKTIVGTLDSDLATPNPLGCNFVNYDSFLQAVYDGNIAIKQSALNQRVQEKQQLQARLALLPKATLDASYVETKNTLFFTSTGTTKISVLSLNFNYPIFSGGSKVAEIAKSSRQVSAARLQLALTKEDIQEIATVLWHNYSSAKLSLKAAQENLQAQEASFFATEQEYKMGIRNFTDFSSAQQNLFLAQVALIEAQAFLVETSFSLNAIIGNLRSVIAN